LKAILEASLRIIELDGTGWKTPVDFMRALYDGIEQGHTHGMSPDAFIDSMIHRGMGGVEPPYLIRIVNLETAPPEVTGQVTMLASLLAKARQQRHENQGIDVEVSITVSQISN
jgi:hypothetical protein